MGACAAPLSVFGSDVPKSDADHTLEVTRGHTLHAGRNPRLLPEHSLRPRPLWAYNLYCERETLSAEPIQLVDIGPGERATLKCTSDVGYGARGAGGVIPPNADLNFDVELFGCK